MRLLAASFALLLLLPLAWAIPEPRTAASWTVVVGPPSLPFQSLGYTPEVLQAAAGDTITFEFRGVHTATSGLDVATEPFEGAVDAAHLNAFDSGTRAAGSTFSVTLTEPGTYVYYCKVGNHRNAGMRAVIVVA